MYPQEFMIRLVWARPLSVFCIGALVLTIGTSAAGSAAAQPTPATSFGAGRLDGAFLPVTAIQTNPLPAFGSDADHRTTDATQIAALIRNNQFDKALALSAELIGKSPDRPAGYNLQGIAHLGKGDFTNARRSFEKALGVSKGNAVAQVNLAHIDIQQKDLASARKRFMAVLAKDAGNVDALLGMAQLDYLKGDAKAALARFEKAKAAHPEAIDPWLNIAAYHLRRNNSAQAVMDLNEAIRIHPDNADLLQGLGQAQMAGGRNEAAVSTFRRLTALQPDAPMGYYRLALAQMASNELPAASESLGRALKLKPDFIEALIALGGIEIRNKRYAEAIQLAKRVQALTPASANGLVLEGDALFAQAQYAESARAYARAHAMAPSGLLITKLHSVQTQSGNAKDAEATLAAWLKQHPDDLPVIHYAALRNLEKGEVKQAIARYQAILRKDPKNLLALNNLAALYQQEADPRALETAEAASRVDPESPVVADTLGWILVSQGKVSRGLLLIESAVAKEPKNLDIRYHLAVARAKSGNKASARKELEAILGSGQEFSQREAAQSLLRQL